MAHGPPRARRAARHNPPWIGPGDLRDTLTRGAEKSCRPDAPGPAHLAHQRADRIAETRNQVRLSRGDPLHDAGGLAGADYLAAEHIVLAIADHAMQAGRRALRGLTAADRVDG